jgi:hypothetical protein
LNVAALLTEFETAGVRLSLAADDLPVRTRPGVSNTSRRDGIVAHKSALLAELSKGAILAALNVEPEHFDGPAYPRLMGRYCAVEADTTRGCRLGVPGSDERRDARRTDESADR